MKCCACKIDKPLEDFSERDGGRRRHTRCRDCQRLYRQEYWKRNSQKYAGRYQNNLEAHRAECRRRYHQGDKLKHRDASWKRKILREYGLTVEDYNRLLEHQSGVCAICGGPDPDGRRLAVDHSHEDNKIRGLLCRSCNTAIGLFKDNPELLEQAAKYLKDNK